MTRTHYAQFDLFGEPTTRGAAPPLAATVPEEPDAPAPTTDGRIASVVDELLLVHGEVSLGDCLARLCDITPELAPLEGLRQAHRYALAQGLAAEEAIDGSARPQNLHALAALVLRPANDPGQADLFRHSAATVAVHALCEALAGHRADEAHAAFDRMVDIGAADHDDYRRLLDALAPVALEPAQHLTEIQATLVPLARRRLGGRARSYLRPLWLDLATRLQATAFSPHTPELHASHAYLEGEDAAQALSSVLGEARWQAHPELVARAAIAQGRLDDRAAARRSWMLLCWRHPQAAAERLRDAGGDRVLARHWRAFNDAELAFDTHDFPAWLLIADAHQREWVPAALAPHSREGEVFALVHALLASGGAIDDRRALQRAHPQLLAVYLAVQARHA